MGNINTQEFKTKTIIQAKKNPAPANSWPIAIDVGYSSTKVMSPNTIAVFPSYAKRVPYGTADTALGQVSQTTIVYRDKEENEYFVGQAALSDASETDSSAALLYARDRYLKTEFTVITRVALGIGSLANKLGDAKGKVIKVSTGLPPAYLNEDKELIIDSFAGTHEFSLKIGNGGWTEFHIEIKKDSDVDVMAQPMGTLFSIASDLNGGPVKDAQKYFSSSLIIFDPGFGTLDLFGIKNGFIKGSSSRDDLGMRAVLEKTAQLIKGKYSVAKSVHQITAALPKGFVTALDRRNHRNQTIEFGLELEQASKDVCMQALDYLDEAYNYLEDVDYLVITGGTGAAWEKYIRNRYKDMSTLHILMGNESDTNIDPIFGNVRGYYMSLVSKLKHK